MPAVLPFYKIRKDKEFNKREYRFVLKNCEFMIREYISKDIDYTIIVTAVHGTNL